MFVELDFVNQYYYMLMLIINEEDQKINQMLVMDDFLEFHDIKNTIHVHF